MTEGSNEGNVAATKNTLFVHGTWPSSFTLFVTLHCTYNLSASSVLVCIFHCAPHTPKLSHRFAIFKTPNIVGAGDLDQYRTYMELSHMGVSHMGVR